MVDFKKVADDMKAEKEAVEGTTDLFGWLNAMFTKARPAGTPPTYMMHRFLASDRDLAPAARWLQLQVREPDLVFRVWQGLLPKERGAPRFQYVAAKKPPKEEALVTRLCSVLAESRRTVEAMLEVVKAAGQLSELYDELGMEES